MKLQRRNRASGNNQKRKLQDTKKKIPISPFVQFHLSFSLHSILSVSQWKKKKKSKEGRKEWKEEGQKEGGKEKGWGEGGREREGTLDFISKWSKHFIFIVVFTGEWTVWATGHNKLMDCDELPSHRQTSNHVTRGSKKGMILRRATWTKKRRIYLAGVDDATKTCLPHTIGE